MNNVLAGLTRTWRGEAGRTVLLGETRGLPKKRRKGSQPELPLPHPARWWESRSRARAGPRLPWLLCHPP